MTIAHVRRFRGLGFGFALALMILLPQAVRAQQVLYGVTFDTSQLIRINTATGAGTAVGTMSFQAFALGISTFNGELFVLDQTNDQLIVVNPNNASTVRTIHVTDDVFSEGDFEIRPSDGKGYYTESNGPFSTVNITTGAATLINGGVPFNIDGLAFNSAGTLYALQTGGSLYTMDPNTGNTTLIGGSNAGAITGGMDFRSDGVLFGAAGDQLFTINPATGAETPIGNIGFQVSGLTFFNVPEPATGLCGAVGAIVMLARRSKR